MVGYLIAVLLLVALVIFIYFDQRKMSSKKKPSSSGTVYFSAAHSSTDDESPSNFAQSSLESLFSKYCQGLYSLFRPLPMWESASYAVPAFLFVFSRLCLISNGFLTRNTPMIEAALDALLEQSDCKYIDYFQSFLPPNKNLPRCDIFAFDDSALSSKDRNYPFILLVALGDCILNPQLVSEGESAPIVISDAFDQIHLLSILREQLTPYLAKFADELYGHFIFFHNDYSLPLFS